MTISSIPTAPLPLLVSHKGPKAPSIATAAAAPQAPLKKDADGDNDAGKPDVKVGQTVNALA